MELVRVLVVGKQVSASECNVHTVGTYIFFYDEYKHNIQPVLSKLLSAKASGNLHPAGKSAWRAIDVAQNERKTHTIFSWPAPRCQKKENKMPLESWAVQ